MHACLNNKRPMRGHDEGICGTSFVPYNMVNTYQRFNFRFQTGKKYSRSRSRLGGKKSWSSSIALNSVGTPSLLFKEIMQGQYYENLNRLLITSLSAMVAESLTFPLDSIKTRMQLSKVADLSIQNSASTRPLLNFKGSEGFLSLYKGLSPALLRHVIYSSVRITVYEKVRSEPRFC